MIREYLQMSKDNKDESEELERLASQLTLSETPQQVSEGSGSGWFDTTVTASVSFLSRLLQCRPYWRASLLYPFKRDKRPDSAFYGSGGTINLYSEAHLYPLLVN